MQLTETPTFEEFVARHGPLRQRRRPRPPAIRWDADAEGSTDSRCSEPDDAQPFLVLRTAVGDVAWLSASPCDFSVLPSWRLGEHFEVPIDLSP